MCALGFASQDAPPGSRAPVACPAEAGRYVALESLLDSQVSLRASSAEEEPPKATITDLVVSVDGELCGVALSLAGPPEPDRVVLVPMELLVHELEGAKNACSLGVARAELDLLPIFDAERAQKDDALGEAVAELEVSFPGRTRQAPEPGPDTAETEETEPKPRHVLASQILGLPVQASDRSFGNVSNAVIDRLERRIDYLVVSHGGALGVADTEYVVPLPATLLSRADEELAFVLGKSAADLEAGIQYEKPEQGFVERATLERADAFFGTAPRGKRAPEEKQAVRG